MPVCKMCEENYPMFDEHSIDAEQQWRYCSEGCWFDSSEYAEIEDQLDEVMVALSEKQLDSFKQIVAMGKDAVKLLVERIEWEN